MSPAHARVAGSQRLRHACRQSARWPFGRIRSQRRRGEDVEARSLARVSERYRACRWSRRRCASRCLAADAAQRDYPQPRPRLRRLPDLPPFSGARPAFDPYTPSLCSARRAFVRRRQLRHLCRAGACGRVMGQAISARIGAAPRRCHATHFRRPRPPTLGDQP